jgi:hypothetical protein
MYCQQLLRLAIRSECSSKSSNWELTIYEKLSILIVEGLANLNS